MNMEKDLFDDEKQILQPESQEMQGIQIELEEKDQNTKQLYQKTKLENHNGNYYTQFIKGYFQLDKLTKNDAKTIIKSGAKSSGVNQLSEEEIEQLIINLDLQLDDSAEQKKEQKEKKAHKKEIKQDQQARIMNEFESQQHFQTKSMMRKKIRYQLIILSLICFAAYFCVTWLTPRFRFFGVGLRFSRGGALAIIVNTVICLLCMSREFITYLYSKKPTGIWRMYLDDNTYVHKVCGSLITFYGFVHTIGHLSSSYVAISQSTDLVELNKHAMFGTFEHLYSYWQLLFASIPGVTGILLIILMVIMQLTAWGIIKEKQFQVFSYIHLSYVLYIIFLVAHGCNFWLNFGFPQSAPFIFIPVILILKQIIKRNYAKRCGHHAQIISAKIIDGEQKIGLLKLRLPEDMYIFPGSFTYINCPDISDNQWHPFSICNLGEKGTIDLMIKDYGDFTKELLKRIHLSNFYIQSLREQQYGQGYFFEHYPKLLMHDIVASPFSLVPESQHSIIVGAGVGISICLQFLSAYQRKDLHVWCISREIELIQEIMKKDIDGVELQVYYTKKIYNINEKIFWRGIQLEKNIDTNLQKLSLVRFGRPKFQKMIQEVDSQLKGAIIDVFVCGPKNMMREVEIACQAANQIGSNQYRMVREKFFK